MPLDPALMLAATRGPQVDSPAEAYGKTLQLGNLFQESQARKIELAKAQRGEADDAATRGAFARNTKIGPDGAPIVDMPRTLADLYTGGQYQAATALASSIRAQKMAETEQNLKALDLQSKRAERAAQITQGVIDNPTQDIYDSAHRQMIQEGVITPDIQQQLPAQFTPDLIPHLKQLVAQGMAAKDFSEAQRQAKLNDSTVFKNKAEADDFSARAEKTKQERNLADYQAVATAAGNTKSQQELDAVREQQRARGASPEALAQVPLQWTPETAQQLARSAMTAEQRTQADRQQKEFEQNTKNQDAMRGMEARRVGFEGARVGLEKARLEFDQKKFDTQYGSGLDPNGQPLLGPDGKPIVSPNAKAAVSGKLSPATVRAMLRKNPGFLGQMLAADKNFDEGTLDNRYNTLHEFTNMSAGKPGGQLLALNTLIHHADLYQEIAQALKGGQFTPGNAVYNKVTQIFGAAPPTTAPLVARFLASETGKVATGGVPAEGEINGILQSMSSSASPAQIADAGNKMIQIATGRAIPLKEKIDQAHIDNLIPVLGPDAKDILSRRGFDPNTLKPYGPQGGGNQGGFNVTDPRGVVHTFKSQADANSFKTAAGIR